MLQSNKLEYKEYLDDDWIKINVCSIRQLNKTKLAGQMFTGAPVGRRLGGRKNTVPS